MHVRGSQAAPAEPKVTASRWSEIAPPPVVRPGRFGVKRAARLVVIALVAVVLWRSHHPVPAAIIGALAVAEIVLAALRPQLAFRLDRVVRRVAHPIASIASALVAGTLQLLVFTPVAVLSRLLGSDPLGTAPSSSYWVDRDVGVVRDLQRRQFAIDVRPAGPGPRRRTVGGLLRSTVVVGTTAAVLNLFAGVAGERLLERAAPAENVVDAPALAGQPWISEFYDEAERLRSHWDPLMGFVRDDFSGQHINIHSMARRTFAPTTSPNVKIPQVFFFGGSTMFGTGQRDLHTIPSELARRAATDGQPINAINYGQSGWVIWQEVELLERLLTNGQIPDVAVFYNGANEVFTQVAELSDQPSYTQAAQVRRRVERDLGRSLYESYVRHSAIHKLGKRLRGGPADPPAVSALTEARAHNAAELHRRAVSLIEKLATAYGFRALFFWQPTVFDKETGEDATLAQGRINQQNWAGAYRAATAQITAPVIDVTDALDSVSEPVFFDRAHTNEKGAALVADAMYPHVAAAAAGL